MPRIKMYTIKAEDVGKHGSITPHKDTCLFCDSELTEYVFESLGLVQPSDVGKRCYKVNGIWQVENEEQFRRRLAQERKMN